MSWHRDKGTLQVVLILQVAIQVRNLCHAYFGMHKLVVLAPAEDNNPNTTCQQFKGA